MSNPAEVTSEADPIQKGAQTDVGQGFGSSVGRFLLSAFLQGMVILGMRAVLFNLYLLRLGYGPEFVGLANGTGWLLLGILSLPSGWLGTRWGYGKTLAIGFGLEAAALVLLPLASLLSGGQRTTWLLVTTILHYLGQCLYFVEGMPFLMSAASPRQRRRAFSAQVGLEPLAAFLGSLAAGLLPGIFASWLHLLPESPFPYGLPLLLAGILLVPAAWVLRGCPSQAVATPAERSSRGAAPVAVMFWIMASVALRLAGRGTSLTFFNVYLDVGLGVPTSLIGVLAAAAQLASVPAAALTPMAIAHLGPVRSTTLGTLGIAACILLLALVPTWQAAGLGNLGATALFALTTASIRILSQEMVAPAWRGAMSGAMMSGAGLTYAAVAFGGGYAVRSLGYSALFLSGAALTTLGALVFFLYFRVPRGELVKD